MEWNKEFMSEELHNHCQSCYISDCEFDVVEDVSCCMVNCLNDCGQKLHACKQKEHGNICKNAVMPCINSQYGCPATFHRRQLARHLDVCPANVVICMMEWNRWHRSSLQSTREHRVSTKTLQNQPVMFKDLDVALAVHDQRVLLETIMPSQVLKYYSDLADGKVAVAKSDERHEPDSARVDEAVKLSISGSPLCNGTGEIEDYETLDFECPNNENLSGRIDPDVNQDHQTLEENPIASKLDSLVKSEVNGHKSMTKRLLKCMYSKKLSSGSTASQHQIILEAEDMVMQDSDDVSHDDSDGHQCTSRHSPTSECPNVLVNKNSDHNAQNLSDQPYNGLFNRPVMSQEYDVEKATVCQKPHPYRDVVKDFESIDSDIKDFASHAPHLMTLLDSPDSAAFDVVHLLDSMISEIVRQQDDAKLPDDHQSNHMMPIVDWNDINHHTSFGEDRTQLSYELRRSISEMMHELGVVCDLSSDDHDNANLHPSTSAEERRRNRRAERKKRSWLFSTGVTGGPLTSWGWGPRKEVKDATTETDDLVIDKTNLEWLSPEAVVSRADLMSRLFSIIGADNRSQSLHEHKQMTPYISNSSTQTVAPFLVHINMYAIGRSLCSAALTSSGQNYEEREYILSLLSEGYTERMKEDFQVTRMSENLTYNSLALENVMESVPRYQIKPSSMFTFMCGCELRRDQFTSHVRNVHCEIMSGLNGWLEERCPYAAYGCKYSQPRFSPDRHDNALVFNQSQNAFAVRPREGARCKEMKKVETSQFEFCHFPYEIHESIFRYLDTVSIDQLSRTCKYMRQVCEGHLTRRGIVKTHWRKRKYDNGTTAWKMENRIWSFPAHFTQIDRWELSDRPFMAQHLSSCAIAASVTPDYTAKKKFSLLGLS